MEFENIIEGLKHLPEVSAICLGGSRASGLCDQKSDYDVYVYYKDKIALEKRREILSPNCTHTEIGVNYFEEEDDCILNNGVVIELIYRNLADFEKLVDDTLTSCNANLGYSTCFFDNILHSQPLYDSEGVYKNMSEKLREYPEELRLNIIKKNMESLKN